MSESGTGCRRPKKSTVHNRLWLASAAKNTVRKRELRSRELRVSRALHDPDTHELAPEANEARPLQACRLFS